MARPVRLPLHHASHGPPPHLSMGRITLPCTVTRRLRRITSIPVRLSPALSTAYMGRMSIRPWRDIARRQSRQIMVGSVPVGGDAPVTVQTMTNTATADVRATVDQIRRCEEEIGRASCRERV